MKKLNQIKSLKIIDKFISKTPINELNSLIEKFDKLEIKGPTFDKYLISLNNDK